MNLNDFLELTNEQLRDKIITEFYLTGKVNGRYMKGMPKGNINPFKEYIRKKLRENFTIINDAENYIEDCYQLTFELLLKQYRDAEKFIGDLFKDGEFDYQQFTATACRIMLMNCIYPNKSGNPNRKLIHQLLHGSSLNKLNAEFNASIVDDNQEIDEYLIDYRITPDFVKEHLTKDELVTFNMMLRKETKYYYNTTNPTYRALAERIREIKRNGL